MFFLFYVCGASDFLLRWLFRASRDPAFGPGHVSGGKMENEKALRVTQGFRKGDATRETWLHNPT